MKRIASSIAIGLSVVMLALISSDSTTKAQPGRTFVADSGVVTLGPNQILRITAANGLNTVTVRFRRLEYTQGTCDGDGVCQHVISSQTVLDPITLAPGEAASLNIAGHEWWNLRGVVTANHQDVRVNFAIINTTTGEVVALYTNNIGGGLLG